MKNNINPFVPVHDPRQSDQSLLTINQPVS
jgi:hypothetical protein